LRRPVRLNPGPHSLVVEKAGSPPFAQKLTVDAGPKVTVEVRLAPTVPDGGVMGAGGASGAFAPDGGFGRPGDTEVPGRGWKWKAAIGTGVAAALVLGFGLTEQILASGHYSDFNSAQGTYGPCDADSRVIENGGQPCPQLLADGDSASRLAVVGFIAGGVLAAGSATLFVLSHMEKRAAANASAGAGATNGVAAAAAGGGRSLLCVPSLAAQAGVSCQIRF
jgi:hypothetical protein